MVLVDTSVWIDFFQYPESLTNQRLEILIKDNNRVVISGLILQEILQGIKDNKSYETTKKRLSKFPFINTDKMTYLHASSLYRTLRSKGVTIPSVDITIASIAILHKIQLFTKDKHFKTIAKHFSLQLH